MKELVITIIIAAFILVVGMWAWQGFTQLIQPTSTTHPQCLEYSRDGSYCFRQSLNQ